MEITVDLRGAPPASRGGTTDIIPEGYYVLKVDKVEPSVNDKGLMVQVGLTVHRGSSEGARLRDTFFPNVTVKDGKESRYGISVFHTFLIACGVATKEAVLKFDSDRLIGKVLVGEVRDGEIAAKGDYPAKKVSQPVNYWNPRNCPADIAAKVGIKVAAEAAPTPAAQPVIEAQPEPEPEPEPVAAPAAVPVAAAAATTSVEADVEDLFK